MVVLDISWTSAVIDQSEIFFSRKRPLLVTWNEYFQIQVIIYLNLLRIVALDVNHVHAVFDSQKARRGYVSPMNVSSVSVFESLPKHPAPTPFLLMTSA